MSHLFVFGPFVIRISNPGDVTVNGVVVPRPSATFNDQSEITAWCRQCLNTN